MSRRGASDYLVAELETAARDLVRNRAHRRLERLAGHECDRRLSELHELLRVRLGLAP